MSVFSQTLIWLISAATIFCILVRPRNIGEAWWACGGAALLMFTTLISFRQAADAAYRGLDVYLFLTGMMILSEMAREEGVFDWIAELAATHAAGSPRKLFLLVYLAGMVVTIFLSNDATAVVLTPAVLAIVRRLKVQPVPYLLACALIANAASFVLPISNPANLVIFNAQIPPLIQWCKLFLAPATASIVITYLALRYLSRRQLRGEITEKLTLTKLSTEGELALAGLIFAAIALSIASAVGWNLGAPTCGVAVIAAALVTSRNRHIPAMIIKGVSWSVLPMVAGLFIMMEALQEAGMLRFSVVALEAFTKLGGVLGNLTTAFSVALLSNIMNNLPVGLITGTAVRTAHVTEGITKSALIGVDLGPNLSVTGSLATILWLIALRRENVKITGWQFFKVGVVVMPLSMLAAILLLRR